MAKSRFNRSNKSSADELPKAKMNKAAFKKFIQLFSFIKPYKYRFFAGLFFLVVGSLTTLAFPYLMGKLIDAGVEGNNDSFFSNINQIALLLFGILIIQSIFSFFRILTFVQVGERTLADIRSATYRKLISFPMEFFAKNRVGDLNSRLSADLSQIQDTITTISAEVLRQIVVLIGGIILLFFTSHKLTLTMLMVLPILVILAVVFGKYIRKISREAQDKLAESNTIVEETLQAIASVKAYTNEFFEQKRYTHAISKVVAMATKGAIYRGLFASFIILGIFGTIVLVIWQGAALVQTGEIKIGDLTSFVIYSTFVGAAMGSFAELYAQIQKALGATERVLEILEEQAEDIDIDHEGIAPQNILKGEISFENLRFTYPSRPELEILRGIDLKVNKGEKLAIVGQSGAGKSTITQLLYRFYQPNNGFVKVDGRNVAEIPLSEYRAQLAIVPQDVILFGGTILENISYGKPEADKEEIIEAAKQANAHSFITQFPDAYETLVGERGIKLSGGQRQRIAIARAILRDPAILILDEATSSLDSESEKLVQDALNVLMKGRTSIIIAHRLSTIQDADRIAVLKGGEITELGTHKELMLLENGSYRNLKELQTYMN